MSIASSRHSAKSHSSALLDELFASAQRGMGVGVRPPSQSVYKSHQQQRAVIEDAESDYARHRGSEAQDSWGGHRGGGSPEAAAAAERAALQTLRRYASREPVEDETVHPNQQQRAESNAGTVNRQYSAMSSSPRNQWANFTAEQEDAASAEANHAARYDSMVDSRHGEEWGDSSAPASMNRSSHGREHSPVRQTPGRAQTGSPQSRKGAPKQGIRSSGAVTPRHFKSSSQEQWRALERLSSRSGMAITNNTTLFVERLAQNKIFGSPLPPAPEFGGHDAGTPRAKANTRTSPSGGDDGFGFEADFQKRTHTVLEDAEPLHRREYYYRKPLGNDGFSADERRELQEKEANWERHREARDARFEAALGPQNKELYAQFERRWGEGKEKLRAALGQLRHYDDLEGHE